MPSLSAPRQHPAGASGMSLTLAFDCAVTGMSVAVVKGGRCLASAVEPGRNQAARLVPAIASVLQTASVERRDIGLLAVTVGPGSFTGVRIGLAAARGLAVALDVPLAGIPTTSALLAEVDDSNGRLAVAAIDSRLGDWFCALGGDPSPFLATTARLAERLIGQRCTIVGAEADDLALSLGAHGIDAVAHTTLPIAATIARLAAAAGAEVWRARNRAEGLPRPLYLRGVNITLPDGARRTVD
jgi:tRNA threonylcarbamoyladenosine biosynthesis protein TsaB